LLWALEAAKETLALVVTLPFPDFAPDYEFVSVSHPNEYPMNERRIVSSKGVNIEPEDFEHVYLEEHIAHSTSLHSSRADSGSSYFVGPLARINLNLEKLMPQALAAARSCGVSWPCRNPYMGIVARAVELIHVCEEALAIIESYSEPALSRAEFKVHAGEGCAATEAPRGLLYHRYRINDQGLVEFSRIVPPTAQNYHRMEDDLKAILPGVLDQPEAAIAQICEKLIRTYDPCISCSTHFVKLHLERG
jgi:coenzyme F420-reducing hydrogenase alpha subunit